jgi:hypothetical protein
MAVEADDCVIRQRLYWYNNNNNNNIIIIIIIIILCVCQLNIGLCLSDSPLIFADSLKHFHNAKSVN